MTQATGYFTHPDCRLHEMGPGHPECPARLDAIEDRLLITGLDMALRRCEAPVASADQLRRVHQPAYLGQLQSECEALGREAESWAPSEQPDYHHLDPDTAINRHSWSAIRAAAGAALEATRAVVQGELANAFCAIRPPGHHAHADRAMGFCFVNNVALAARYALEELGLQRVAIVDFDVHHGNGTESLVAGDPRILMCSFFQHPFYPEGGSRSDAPNLLNLPVPAYTRGAQVRELVAQHWLPRLDAHRPELLLVSAGFDAHREDDMGQMGLVEQDYAWITERLMEVAQCHAQGRLVSCLEGGYQLSALARSVEAHLRVLTGLSR